jgi:hypothetical protein
MLSSFKISVQCGDFCQKNVHRQTPSIQFAFCSALWSECKWNYFWCQVINVGVVWQMCLLKCNYILFFVDSALSSSQPRKQLGLTIKDIWIPSKRPTLTSYWPESVCLRSTPFGGVNCKKATSTIKLIYKIYSFAQRSMLFYILAPLKVH